MERRDKFLYAYRNINIYLIYIQVILKRIRKRSLTSGNMHILFNGQVVCTRGTKIRRGLLHVKRK